ncbi:MAPEG family protein [Dyella soli]|uniref:MAPEG family protein n=1 Tax=Dyella soli TaxID=522319 RepID=A0A4R0YWD9_9GAMM|nr:MAPEG family protein [Dyella soli]TCI09794.1 hypothetical protein EZM97_12610 [Dyella soli]
MSVELKMLVWSIVLGLLHVLVAATFSTMQRGLAWHAGNRENPQPLVGVAARTDRASRNFLETFVFFAAAVLSVVLAQRGNAMSALGAQIYFWARLAYLPIYAIGIPYVRTLVWAASLAGVVMVLAAVC